MLLRTGRRFDANRGSLSSYLYGIDYRGPHTRESKESLEGRRSPRNSSPYFSPFNNIPRSKGCPSPCKNIGRVSLAQDFCAREVLQWISAELL